MRTNWFVIVVRHVVHFGFSSHKLTMRESIGLQTICTEPNAGARCLYPNMIVLAQLW
jgi:hypothetical protein